MTTRFKNAIDALVHAFFNDTLAKGECTACACANIVAHVNGVKIDPNDLTKIIETPFGFHTGSWFTPFISPDSIFAEKGDRCIASTGFSFDEFIRIERAFESNTKINYWSYYRHSKEAIMQDQYNGLCAVVDVLCEIEGIEDPAEYKELFAIAQ